MPKHITEVLRCCSFLCYLLTRRIFHPILTPMHLFRFFKALGYVSSVISVSSFLVNQAVSTGASIWLATWSDHTGSVIENGTFSNTSLSDELGRYSVLSCNSL